MRLFYSLVFMTAAFAWGCASTTSSGQGASQPRSTSAGAALARADDQGAAAQRKPGSNVICKKVKITGSRIKKTRCTTRAQRDEMKDGAEQFMLRSQRGMGTKEN